MIRILNSRSYDKTMAPYVNGICAIRSVWLDKLMSAALCVVGLD